MNEIWNKFIEVNNGQFLARDVFEDLCYKILDKHYPGRAIVSINDIEEADTKNLNVIFVAKLFTDKITNSRKGQIRKAFKKFLTNRKNNNLKTYAWVFCVSHRLDNDEMLWWINWNTKMTKEHEVNIQLIDGDYIVELAQKYKLYDEYFEEKQEIIEEKHEKLTENNEENDFPFELLPDNEKYVEKYEKEQPLVVNEKTEENKKTIVIDKDTKDTDEIENEDKKDNEENEIDKKEKSIEEKDTKDIDEVEKEKKEDKEEKEEKETKRKNDFEKENEIEKNKEKQELGEEENKSDKNENKKEETKKSEHNKEERNKKENKETQEKKIKPAKKQYFEFKFDLFQNEFKRIKNFANELTREEKEDLKAINSNKNWDKQFDFNENTKTTTTKLFYKAKSLEVRKEYIKAVFVYEELLKIDDFKKVLKHKIDETHKSLKMCQNKVEGILNELEGDVYFIRNNQIKAIELYEKSHKIDKSKDIYARKFYETLGDNQIENDLPQEAYKSYALALKHDKFNSDLEIKQDNAKHLANGKEFIKMRPFSLLNVFVAPVEYWRANSIISTPETRKKLNESSKRLFYALGILGILAVFIFFGIKGLGRENYTPKEKNIIVNSSDFQTAKTLDEIAITYGDDIMSNISWDKIHLVDTAIAAYNRALDYNSTSKLAYSQLKIAETYKKEYISKVQANILLDSAAYFVSMRRTSEGLRLFKYLFEPNKMANGKYGFVDTNMQIVIPPMYDFNYKKMYNGKENFNNGRAIVCLVHSVGDTNYYRIDRFNHLLKKN